MTAALGRGSGRRTGRFTRFVRGLFLPRSVVHLLPPPPRTAHDIGRDLIVRSVITEIISGRDTTFAEKAAFVLGPEAIAYAARRGADAGARQVLPPPPTPPIGGSYRTNTYGSGSSRNGPIDV